MTVSISTFASFRVVDPTDPRSVIIPTGGRKLSSGTHAFFPPSAFPASLRGGLLPCVLDETDTSFETATGMCTVVIDFEDGEIDKSSWLEMWRATVPVTKICVRKGKAGTAFDLGEPLFHQSMFDDMLRLPRSRQNVDAFAAFMLVGRHSYIVHAWHTFWRGECPHVFSKATVLLAFETTLETLFPFKLLRLLGTRC